MELQERLNLIFREVFDDDTIVISPRTAANDIEAWDSLSHVTLIVAIETRFGIRFTQKELMVMRNVGDLLAVIGRKTAD